ncbi:MAG: putative molybdenum carrier protein [Salinisphaeraceae bacterium]
MDKCGTLYLNAGAGPPDSASALGIPRDASLAIISGAQAGVDRGALDAALEANVPCGGWVPAGRKAEDGPVPSHYPIRELEGGYRQRTRQNVLDSDGTVLIYFGEFTGGTRLTLRFCLSKDKPFLLLDATEMTTHRAAQRVRKFVAQHAVRCLNVAGPRESGSPGAHAYSYAVVRAALSLDGPKQAIERHE